MKKTPIEKTDCKNGHPQTAENRLKHGGCKVCKRAEELVRRRAKGVRAVVSKCPHGPDAPKRPNRSDCANCHRERELQRGRSKGAKPYVPPTHCAKRGHELTDETRRKGPGKWTLCAVCHRIDENDRRKAAIAESRRRAREYARAHKAEARARHKAWREANVERARAYARDAQRARHVGRDPDGKEYLKILLRDPCSYCGGPAGTIDHIRPVVRGGANVWENLTAACKTCNLRKHDSQLLVFMLRFATESAA